MLVDSAKQVAALPYRTGAHGGVEVMLITSRQTKRWIIPKGNLMPGLEPFEAAAQEAFEEAGLSGIGNPSTLGSFQYDKCLPLGEIRSTIVDVFPLAVTQQADDWPELGQRECRWFDLSDAAEAVDEPELKAIISKFRMPSSPKGKSKKRRSKKRR